jgi:hypothetical protein
MGAEKFRMLGPLVDALTKLHEITDKMGQNYIGEYTTGNPEWPDIQLILRRQEGKAPPYQVLGGKGNFAFRIRTHYIYPSPSSEAPADAESITAEIPLDEIIAASAELSALKKNYS